MTTSASQSALTRPERFTWGQRLYRIYNSEMFTGYLFILVPVLLLFILKVYPVFYNFYLSFHRYELFEPPTYVGLKNYDYIRHNEVTRKAIGNTIKFALEAVPLGTAIALIVAKLLDQPIPGKTFFRTLFYLPVISSIVVSSLVWNWIYNSQDGMLNAIIGVLGIEPQGWLSNPHLAMPALVVVIIWGSIGGNMIIFLAGLQDIPREVLEAAKVDGANPFQSFLFITVPMLRPVILFVVVTFTIAVFRNFGLIFMMTQGGPLNSTNTMVWEVYMNVFGYLRLGRGAAISMVMLAIVFVITLLSFRVLRERGE
jgi:multiple sugar transport system permease protein